MMTASAMKPIIRRRGERRAEQPVPDLDADQRERDRRENHKRQQEAAELRDHQDVDGDDRTPNAAPMSRNVT